MSEPAVQKILKVSAPFGDYVVTTAITIPTPAPGELLVRIYAAGLNPSDWKLQFFGQLTGMMQEQYPLTLGVEGAGIIEGVASDVAGFSKGDRVVFQGRVAETYFEGTFRRYHIIPAYLAAKIPDNITFEQGATILAALPTVAIPLYSHKPEAVSLRLSPPWESEGLGKYVGKTAFVPGGASQVGLYALQFLRLSGFSPIITTASAHNFELVKLYGATHVLDRKLPAEKLIGEIMAITGGPVDLVYDAVSEEETLIISVAVLRRGGQIAYVAHFREGFLKLFGAPKGLQSAAAQGSLLYERNRGSIAGLLDKLSDLLREGVIKPTPFEVLPGGLHAVKRGLERLKNNEVSGVKLVVCPDDTQE
ncbi:GroES-like protein [Earliella scabrosa]|nr:GroES-like protein [Earliella scabrosa]